jgi:prepilin-type N-terminal cleavage/methylation domain-containing protein
LELHVEPRRAARAGFSLVELTVAMSVLVVGLLAYTRAATSAALAARTTRETTLATEAAWRIVESMRAQASFDQVFRLYNTSTADDPFGVAVPGAGFAVPGLRTVPGDADGLPGEIVFPTTTVGGVLQLREDVVDAKLGTPRDLDGDGVIDGNDHSANYKLLPVLVRVRWRGVAGNGLVELPTMLANF